MKQVLQSARTGETAVTDVPVPALPSGFVLVRTVASLVSAGTERMMVEFAGKSLVGKAASRPDLVRQVLRKAQRDGLLVTLDAVRHRQDEVIPLGYSAAGEVLEVRNVEGLQPGDRVACAGAGFANHAEVICIPRNLCVPVPAPVSFEEAVFATLGAIALHGVRLAELELGARVAVIGLGLLGQITVQLARSSGCRVLGIDIRGDRVQLASQLGADRATTPEEAEPAAAEFTGGDGLDAVLIAADTPSSDPVALAGSIARDRGVVVAVGAVGMEIPRRTYYAKELRFLVSRSTGPGRYDDSYEIEGRDYPLGYVRWTERRNLSAFLDLVAGGVLRVAPLISHRIRIEDAAACDLVTGRRKEPFLGIVLTYATEPDLRHTVPVARAEPGPAAGTVKLGMLGAGNFARSVLLPAFSECQGAAVKAIASRQGISARGLADRYRLAYCTSDEESLLRDPDLDAVAIATRHHLHARQALAAHAAGKHVFVEKPLCLSESELEAVERAFGASGAPILMVGFNRRFAPMSRRLAEFFSGTREPLVAHYRVNAGRLPPEHWTHDPSVGGGRIVGEGCHFLDLLGWLVRHPPVAVSAFAPPDGDRYRGDNLVVSVRYADGSIGTVTYLASGDARLRKERLEVHSGGRSAVLEDFRSLELFSNGRRSVSRSWTRQDKGHRAGCQAFVDAIRTGRGSPTPLAELVLTTRLTFLALESARTGEIIRVPCDRTSAGIDTPVSESVTSGTSGRWRRAGADVRSLGASEIAHRAWFSAAKTVGLLRRRFPAGHLTADDVRRALGPPYRRISAESWLEHLQSRQVPAFFFAPSDRPVFGELLKSFPEALLHRGDRLAAGGTLLFGERVDLPQPVDWHRDPFSGYSWAGDRHWTALSHAAPEGADVRAVWEVSRQRDLFVLGRAYWRTWDERYAAAAATRIRAWLTANPPKTGINWWSNLEIAVRSIAWIWALHWFAGFRAFDAQLVWALTAALIASGRHVKRLLSYTRACMPGNHVVGDAAGLAVIALALPEIDDAAEWRDTALQILREEARTQVTDSGAHVEEAPGYHLFVCELFYLAAALAERNGVVVPEIWNAVHRMIEAAVFVARPDRTLPASGDADESAAFDLGESSRVEALAALAAVRFHRGDFKSVVQEAPELLLWLEGPAALDAWRALAPSPAPLMTRNAMGGAARQDWSTEADYCFLRGGTLTRHAHADALHLEVVVGGRPS